MYGPSYKKYRSFLFTAVPKAKCVHFLKIPLQLTLILLTWRIWWAPNNASKWQMEFNSAFKGLTQRLSHFKESTDDLCGLFMIGSDTLCSLYICQLPNILTCSQDTLKVMAGYHYTSAYNCCINVTRRKNKQKTQCYHFQWLCTCTIFWNNNYVTAQIWVKSEFVITALQTFTHIFNLCFQNGNLFSMRKHNTHAICSMFSIGISLVYVTKLKIHVVKCPKQVITWKLAELNKYSGVR
jgi:hypothetical protein